MDSAAHNPGQMGMGYDVIIVGSGAGGGTLARHLAPSGKRILILERGSWLPREPQNWQTTEVFVDNRYISPDTWFDGKGRSFQPQIHYFVGGATKLYGAALYRLRAEDFGELRHHDGISPEWPVSYDEMEPYYTAAEQMYQVHGSHGEDPTEPRASAPYPFPAVSHEPRIQQLADDLVAHGLHPFHAPCGILLNESNMPYSTCVRCPTCDGFPCPLHAKADAEVMGVRPALEYPNVTLLTDAMAVRLDTNPAGTEVTAVVVEHEGHFERYAANIIVVSAGAANSAKLLLRSTSGKHPNGLANGSDQVGRNYMFHDSQAVLALSKEPNPTVFQKTLGVNDFYFEGPDFPYPMGNIQMIGKSQAEMFRGEKPIATKLAPEWALGDVADHAVDFWLSTEDLPMPDNRVTLDRDANVRLAYKGSNPTASKRLYHQLKSMLGNLGMHPDHLLPRFAYMKSDIPVAGVAHQAGTCRMGNDPMTSVVNADCRAHEVDNLYIVDTSVFPSIGAVNPALTAMANALRVGDHLLGRMGATAAAGGALPTATSG
jgi:choline dehydrogenase-like flavoprotein